MSYSIDVNVLLCATARSDPRHEQARAFLDRCRTSPTVCCLAWPTLLAYLRMATHAAIVSPPISHASAVGNVSALLALPQVRAIGEADGFWEAYQRVASPLAPRGKLVPDVHLATLLRQHGVGVLYTNDQDFQKFPFLRVESPFDGATP